MASNAIRLTLRGCEYSGFLKTGKKSFPLIFEVLYFDVL